MTLQSLLAFLFSYAVPIAAALGVLWLFVPWIVQRWRRWRLSKAGYVDFRLYLNAKSISERDFFDTAKATGIRPRLRPLSNRPHIKLSDADEVTSKMKAFSPPGNPTRFETGVHSYLGAIAGALVAGSALRPDSEPQRTQHSEGVVQSVDGREFSSLLDLVAFLNSNFDAETPLRILSMPSLLSSAADVEPSVLRFWRELPARSGRLQDDTKHPSLLLAIRSALLAELRPTFHRVDVLRIFQCYAGTTLMVHIHIGAILHILSDDFEIAVKSLR
ncbi:hypothetical protein AKG11_11485 [Shinella sp. SUS2]|nr:hypothetical protein AKG11_11485 [Shinella sp. SUS2]KOC73860.1 hypothetical protein AKG10_19935 [Shinella sp. GWS1]